jgi:peroxiredoxin
MKKQIIFLFISFFSFTVLMAQPQQGRLAREISLPSVNGDTITLSSLKGKVVLLDFWASWCGPCRTSNRNLVKLYSKYHDKGFEILGVSLDDEPSKWKEAIRKDKVSWIQVNDPGGWEAKTAIAWEVMAIPTSYLIDRNGTLLAMDLEGRELEKALKYLLDK